MEAKSRVSGLAVHTQRELKLTGYDRNDHWLKSTHTEAKPVMTTTDQCITNVY